MNTYVDLFCGAGGFSKGFDDAGFTNIFSIEYDQTIAETYKYNFPNHNLIVDDIKNVSNAQIKAIVGNKTIDVIIGGAPCQGFSKAGTPGRTFTDDPRNYLFKEFVRVVDCLKPSAFVFENVAALANHNKGKTILEIIHSFEEIGYNVVYQIMNTSDYGIPQERRRLIMVGTLNTLNLNFTFPPKDNIIITVKDAISDLPPLRSGQTSNIPNHIAMKHSKQMLEKMSYVSDGGDRSQIPESIRPKSGDVRKYIRYSSTKPSICITGDMRKVFHYSQNRALTARELARLQSFPDDFTFIGSSISIQQQIGNAVPPTLAYKIAKQIEVMLNGNVSNCKFYRE